VKFLVGGVNLVIGKSETHENDRTAEDLLKGVYDGNGSAGANEDRKKSKTLFVGEGRCLQSGMIAVYKSRFDRSEYA
jgi:hypothetical protein